MFHWILTTHIVALLPLLMLTYSFKKYRQYESLYIDIKDFKKTVTVLGKVVQVGKKI